MNCQSCGYDDNGTGDFAHACAPLNLSDPAVQKRLATQWGYVQKPHPDCDSGCMFQCANGAPSVPIDSIGRLLTRAMDVAVANGANSVSMPDELVEVAAWLSGVQPAPSVPENKK